MESCLSDKQTCARPVGMPHAPDTAAAATSPFACFDSHGALWVACDPEEPGAMPFGPTGIGREAAEEEVDQLLGHLGHGETAYVAARRLGLVRREGGLVLLDRTPCQVTVSWRKSGTRAAFTSPGDPWWSLEASWPRLCRASRCVQVLDYSAMAEIADVTYRDTEATYRDDTIRFEGQALVALARSELRAADRLEEAATRDAARLLEIAQTHELRLPEQAVFSVEEGSEGPFDVPVFRRLRNALDGGRWHAPHDALGLCVERLGYRIGSDCRVSLTSQARLVPLAEGEAMPDWLNDSRAYWARVLAEMGETRETGE